MIIVVYRFVFVDVHPSSHRNRWLHA